MPTFTRRTFLQTAAAFGATVAWGKSLPKPSSIAWTERRDLFLEGVASGDPDSNSVLLWTRREPDPQHPAERLKLELAVDEQFRRSVQAMLDGLGSDFPDATVAPKAAAVCRKVRLAKVGNANQTLS